MEILSFIFNALGLILSVMSFFVKGKDIKKVLALVLSGNFCVGVSYLLSGAGVNGAVSCFLGAFQGTVNYLFDLKNKPIPKWLIAVYGLSFVTVNLMVIESYIGLLAIAACLAFVMSICQKSSKNYRRWILLNTSLWAIYDVITKSYGPLITHTVIGIFVILGMIVNDKNEKNA